MLLYNIMIINSTDRFNRIMITTYKDKLIDINIRKIELKISTLQRKAIIHIQIQIHQ